MLSELLGSSLRLDHSRLVRGDRRLPFLRIHFYEGFWLLLQGLVQYKLFVHLCQHSVLRARDGEHLAVLYYTKLVARLRASSLPFLGLFSTGQLLPLNLAWLERRWRLRLLQLEDRLLLLFIGNYDVKLGLRSGLRVCLEVRFVDMRRHRLVHLVCGHYFAPIWEPAGAHVVVDHRRL